MKNSSQCSNNAYQGCTLPKYEDYNECILHCSKENTKKDYHMTSIMRDNFKNELINYIVKSIPESSYTIPSIDEEVIINSIKQSNVESSEHIQKILKDATIVFNFIEFPTRDERDQEDYEPILNLLGKIHFNYCKFYLPYLNLKNIQCFFQDCEFFDSWSIYNYDILQNQSNVIYQMCKFHNGISAAGSKPEIERLQLSHSQFSDCDFSKELILEYVDIKAPLFNNSGYYKGNTKYLKVYHCNVDKRFVLNQYCIENIEMQSSIFRDKFEFKSNCSKEFSIDNCNFDSIADFYDSSFEKFIIKKSIFSNFTGFEECKFGNKEKLDNEGFISKFEYVTFLNKINFRNTIFNNGLDVAHANFIEEPSFLNAKIEPLYTTRETFRSIKHSFDSVGNYLDANKYFAMEMQKYKEELSINNGKRSEKLVFWLNEKISNFGQDYTRPIFIFIGSAILYYLIFCISNIDFKYNIPSFITTPNDLLNNFAKSIMPFKSFLTNGIEFISLVFSIWYSILIWQTLVAVKRFTRR
jgi:uncharacterized protein YjbI with pentapeptide repeats